MLVTVSILTLILQMEFDPEFQPSFDTGDASSKQISGKKRTRGPTVLDRIAKVRASGQKIPVETNYDGIPIDENGKDLMTYVGIVARDTVAITYNSWDDVPKSLKERIWDTLMVSLSHTFKLQIYMSIFCIKFSTYHLFFSLPTDVIHNSRHAKI